MENLLRTAITAILLLFITSLWSSHIVGGELSYKFRRFNVDRSKVTFEITLNLYRDPKGLEFDQYANFGVYVQEPWGAWRSYETIEFVNLGEVTEVMPGTDPCRVRNLTDEQLELGLYTFEVTLDVTGQDYLVSYQKCCRNFSISNIVGSGDVGSVYDVLITAEAIRAGNNSPVFGSLPPIFVCSNEPLFVDNAATDEEGDELVYSLCTPNFSGTDESFDGACGTQNPNPAICPPPYPEVVYNPPFSSDFPMFSDPPLSLHSENGLLTGTPTQSGSYVAAICISEYRNGVLLSESRRDFEFNVVQCMDNLQARVQSASYLPSLTADAADSIATFQSCHNLDFTFINQSADLRFIRTYSWLFWDEDNEPILDVRNSNIRDLDISFPSPGKYTGQMILNEGENCVDTAYLNVEIISPLEPRIYAVYDSCVAGPVLFQLLTNIDERAFDAEWNFGDGMSDAGETVLHTYDVRGTYEVSVSLEDEFGCMEQTNSSVEWVPFQLTPPDTLQSGIEICEGDSLFINGQTITEAGQYLNIVPSEFNGCDSIVELIEVMTNPLPDQKVLNDSICIGDSYLFNQLILTESGMYLDTFVNINGCDSIVLLDLKVIDPPPSIEKRDICIGEIILWQNMLLSQSGIYTDTLLTAMGCDSLTILDLKVLERKEFHKPASICNKEFYILGSDTLFDEGTYMLDTLSKFGCDSTVILTLEVNPTYDLHVSDEICQGGESIFAGQVYTNAGSYTELFKTEFGCDSMVTLELSVIPETRRDFRDTICLGETYAFGEINLSIPGIYVDTITNRNGCDSIVVLDLVVGENLTRINVDEELELAIGTTITLEPEVRGGDLINTQWFEVDEFLSDGLTLNYLVSDEEWVFFQSTNNLFCVALDSIFINAFLDPNIYFPNVFTPDGDGINDLFNIGASDVISQSQLFIFDRWGNEMYAGDWTTDLQIESGWDGTYNNTPVGVGTYAYMVRVIFINGESAIFSGDITVVR